MPILFCLNCGSQYDPAQPLWMCPCGGPLDLYFKAPVFPVDAVIGRHPGLWRYREALPIRNDSNIVSLGEPMTPLLPTDYPGLLLKLDYLFPTGSFKDRGASVMISKIHELGIDTVVEDSSGNAGAAIAAYSAKAGIRCRIYISADASESKVRQIELYGAELVKVNGQRADAAKAAFKAATTTYYASHYWNPYFFEGTKTVAFEIWEQLGRRIPDNVVAPVGHGTLLLGLYKGFEFLARAGITHQLPRVFGVQIAACAPLVEMFRHRLETLPKVHPRPTVAEGIVISTPIRWRSILEAVTRTHGMLIQVDDAAVLKSLHGWARQGTLMEATSATATAAYDKLITEKVIDVRETTVVTVTGAGIKTAVYV